MTFLGAGRGWTIEDGLISSLRVTVDPVATRPVTGPAVPPWRAAGQKEL